MDIHNDSAKQYVDVTDSTASTRTDSGSTKRVCQNNSNNSRNNNKNTSIQIAYDPIFLREIYYYGKDGCLISLWNNLVNLRTINNGIPTYSI